MAAKDHPHVVVTPYEATTLQEAAWGKSPVQFRIHALNRETNTFAFGNDNYLGTELLKELHLAIGEELVKRARSGS